MPEISFKRTKQEVTSPTGEVQSPSLWTKLGTDRQWPLVGTGILLDDRRKQDRDYCEGRVGKEAQEGRLSSSAVLECGESLGSIGSLPMEAELNRKSGQPSQRVQSNTTFQGHLCGGKQMGRVTCGICQKLKGPFDGIDRGCVSVFDQVHAQGQRKGSTSGLAVEQKQK